MKSSAPTAIILTIFMFLLVLIAAVFFWLYYERLTLQGDIQSVHDNARIIEAQQAENEVNNLATQAALNTILAISTSTAAENVERAKQLANSDQLNATMLTKEAQLSSELEDASAVVNAYESQAPLVKVVEPQANAIIIADEKVEIVIVATDYEGVRDISFTIGGDPATFPDEPVEDSRETAIRRYEWIPPNEGDFELKITATNDNGFPRVQTMILTVLAPTSTPEPADIPEPSATANSS